MQHLKHTPKLNCVYLINQASDIVGHQLCISPIFSCTSRWFRSGTLQQQTIASTAGAQALHLSVLLAVVCLCGPCDTTYFLELWRIRSLLMFYCSSVLLLLSLFEPNKYLLLLLTQTTFNSLRFICWARLCCLMAQNIMFISSYTVASIALLAHSSMRWHRHTSSVRNIYVALTPMPHYIYDLDQPRTTYDDVTEAPIATAVTSSRPWRSRHCRLPNCASDTRLNFVLLHPRSTSVSL